MGATQANNFPRQANGYEQAEGDHPSPRTDLDSAERLTGIYGSKGCGPNPSERFQVNGSALSLAWHLPR